MVKRKVKEKRSKETLRISTSSKSIKKKCVRNSSSGCIKKIIQLAGENAFVNNVLNSRPVNIVGKILKGLVVCPEPEESVVVPSLPVLSKELIEKKLGFSIPNAHLLKAGIQCSNPLNKLENFNETEETKTAKQKRSKSKVKPKNSRQIYKRTVSQRKRHQTACKYKRKNTKSKLNSKLQRTKRPMPTSRPKICFRMSEKSKDMKNANISDTSIRFSTLLKYAKRTQKCPTCSRYFADIIPYHMIGLKYKPQRNAANKMQNKKESLPREVIKSTRTRAKAKHHISDANLQQKSKHCPIDGQASPNASTETCKMSAKKRKRNNRSISNSRISKRAKATHNEYTEEEKLHFVSQFTENLMLAIAQKAAELAKKKPQHCLTEHELENAVRLVLPSNLAESTIQSAKRTFIRYYKSV